jgi:uncharacterized protein involved in tolerance to divalent cations
MSHLTEAVIKCANWQQAQRLADALLEKQLVSSIETFEIHNKHWWDGPHHSTQEVKLLVIADPLNQAAIESLANHIRQIKTASVTLSAPIK